jgi:WhiB family redox-sensing transcriptional regulator
VSVTRPLFSAAQLKDRESWQDDAACKGVDIGIFFSLDDDDQKQALELCRSCPVQQQCLRDAIEHGETYGIWGGMKESERRGIIRDRRRQDRDRRRTDAA